MNLKGAFGLIATAAMLASVQGHTTANPAATYDPDPQHLWNRVYRQFYVRVASDGTEYGVDSPDLLLTIESESLFHNPTYQQTLDLLDEFLKTNAEALITEPTKRAFFQRDLWAVFDWLSLRTDNYLPERQALQQRVAQIIRRVALSDEQIAGLPNAYALAVSAQAFATHYDANQPLIPYLPPDLWQADSAWVQVGNQNGIVVITHVGSIAFNGRSAFYVFYRLPAGRQAALDYLAALNAAKSVDAAPMPPEGMRVALVRQMLLIDANGSIVPSPISESLQLRIFPPNLRRQVVLQFNLSRRRLFAGQAGGLYAVAPGDKEIPAFESHSIDPFENPQITIEQAQVVTLDLCSACHFGNDAGNLITFSRTPFPLPDGERPTLIATDKGTETARIIAWKQSQANWRTLQQLWSQGHSSS